LEDFDAPDRLPVGRLCRRGISRPGKCFGADKIKFNYRRPEYHKWQKTTRSSSALGKQRLLTVDVATSPAARQDMSGFKPEFSKYAVIRFQYNGIDWSPTPGKRSRNMLRAAEDSSSVHAADNSFPQWAEYNKMIDGRRLGRAEREVGRFSAGEMGSKSRTQGRQERTANISPLSSKPVTRSIPS